MATLHSSATGNWTAAGTWSLCNSTAELDSEAGTTNISTSNLDSAAFMPGAITVDGIAIKVNNTITPTGTITVTLRNSTISSDVTSVTVNCSDLGVNGWHFFKFSSSQLLSMATNYLVRIVRSVADGASDRVTLYRDGTANNHTRQLRTTTTQAPVAGDKMIVAGDLTGAGTGNDITVTMNETVTTDYGTSSTTLSSLSVNKRGTLTWGVAASTNYYLKLSGILDVYAGGTLNMGTVASPMPSTSTSKLEFDCAANVDFGLRIQPTGTFVAQGNAFSATSYKTLLNTDEAAAATVLGVDSTAGWEANGVVAIASTTRTASQCESRTIATVDSATQITITSGLTNAHSGTAPIQAEVIYLTRNVKIFGKSTSLQAYIQITTTATVDMDYVEVYNMGSATSLKRGVTIQTTTGSCNIQFCSLYDFVVTSSFGLYINTSSGSVTCSKNVLFNVANYGINVDATSGAHTLEDNVVMLTTGVLLADAGSTFNGNTIAGSTGTALTFNEAIYGGGPFTNLTIHSGASNSIIIGVNSNALVGGWTFTNLKSWRNSQAGCLINTASDIILDSPTLFGNTTANIDLSYGGIYGGSLTIKNGALNGDTTFSTTSGIRIQSGGWTVTCESTTLGTASGILTTHATQDILPSDARMWGLNIKLRNCKLDSTTEIGSQTNLTPQYSRISSDKHDQTAGSYKCWKRYGSITNDTTIFDVSPSMRLTPSNATYKLESDSFHFAVNSGATSTITCKVRTSVAGDGSAYNGAAPRLILKRNDALGITADTVLDSYSVAAGTWETLSGTTPSFTGNGVIEVVVDCDGTVGWVNADTVTAGNTQATAAMGHWTDGNPWVSIEPAAAGGGIKSSGGYLGMF